MKDLTRELDRSDSVIFLVVFIFFIILSAFMLLNMLIGVLHEVVTQVTHNEKEKNAIDYVKNTIAYVISKGDDDADGFISKAEFEHLIKNESIRKQLRKLDVDVDSLAALTDFIFVGRNNTEIEFSHFEFLTLILSLRLTNTARVMDSVILQTFLARGFKDGDGVLHETRQAKQAAFTGLLSQLEALASSFEAKVDLHVAEIEAQLDRFSDQ